MNTKMTYEELLTACTDNMYKGLFGFGVARANELLGLPQDTDEETRRDHLGTLALQAFGLLEHHFGKALDQAHIQGQSFSQAQCLHWSLNMAKVAATHYRTLVSSGERLLTANHGDDVQ